jgi:ketosteroid isomerase-like protein
MTMPTAGEVAMDRRGVLFISIASVGLGFLTCGAEAQQASDIEAIKAANQAFYAALSARDLKAMEGVWANKPYVVNIGPKSKAIAVGYTDAVSKYWANAFDFFSQMSASTASVAQIQTDGKTAWVIGTETAMLQPKSGGDPLKFETFVTNIFEKDGNRWLMISHHAQAIPQ